MTLLGRWGSGTARQSQSFKDLQASALGALRDLQLRPRLLWDRSSLSRHSVVAWRVRHGSVTAGEIDAVLKNPYSGVGSGHEHDAGAKGRWSGVAIRDSRIASHLPQDHGPRGLGFARASLFGPGRRGLDIDHRGAVECHDRPDLHAGAVNLTHGHRMQGRGGSVVPVSGCKVRAGLPSVSERLSSPRGSPPPRRIWPRITTW